MRTGRRRRAPEAREILGEDFVHEPPAALIGAPALSVPADASAPPAWLDELRLEPGPPWHSMGTRGVAGGWRPDPDPEQVARKRAVLDAHRDDVVVLPDDRAAECGAAARFVAGAGGFVIEPPPSHSSAASVGPLEAAARHVAEDLCILVPGASGWVLAAGIVCFPSMWRLPDKVGMPMTAVHGPVPAYAGELAARVDRFLDRLTPDRPAWRRNWFVHDRPELFLPPAPASRPAPVAVPDGLWVRSERQTLIRLPDAEAILFTIRT
ncbi:MAG TPA: DUF3445 domain-containing protein, partial [Acidimicrobiales bacterium]|nr:DUF3445 domain-containing protein [Acidimicrobiales bacterium]